MTKTIIDYNDEKRKKELAIIFDLIDASCEQAAHKGEHALENGCNCIACVNKRKKFIEPVKKKWRFRL